MLISIKLTYQVYIRYFIKLLLIPKQASSVIIQRIHSILIELEISYMPISLSCYSIKNYHSIKVIYSSVSKSISNSFDIKLLTEVIYSKSIFTLYHLIRPIFILINLNYPVVIPIVNYLGCFTHVYSK